MTASHTIRTKIPAVPTQLSRQDLATVFTVLTPGHDAVILLNRQGRVQDFRHNDRIPLPPALKTNHIQALFSRDKSTLTEHFLQLKSASRSTPFHLVYNNSSLQAQMLLYHITAPSGASEPWVFLTLTALTDTTSAAIDTVTKLPSRTDAVIRLKNYEPSQGSVTLIDITQFSEINSRHGDRIGDAVLEKFADKLSALYPRTNALEPNFLAKFADDVFLLITPFALQTPQLDNLVHACSQPISCHNISITPSVHIGTCPFPSVAESPSKALPLAQHALLLAKKDSEKQYTPYVSIDTSKKIRYDNHQELKRNMPSAFNEGQFELNYQAFVDSNLAITGAEVLMRWPRCSIPKTFPDTFIPIAEQSGFIETLDDWALKIACQSLSINSHLLPPNFKLSVNLSPLQLASPNFIDALSDTLDLTNFPPSQLQLEITESYCIQDLNGAIRKLTDLRNLGVQIALDDFGKGYSNLSALSQLPLTTLKIDKSFVDNVLTPTGLAVCQLITNFAHNLNMSVTAEGVESDAQFTALQNINVDTFQGYFAYRPTTLQTLLQNTQPFSQNP